MTRSDGQEEPRRLTRDAFSDTVDIFPAWSPDQAQIEFVRRRGAASGDMIVILRKEDRSAHCGRFASWRSPRSIGWHGPWMVRRSPSPRSRSSQAGHAVIDAAGGWKSAEPDGSTGRCVGDASSAFSPDGRSLAFVRWSSPATSTLLVQKLGDGMETLGAPATVPVASRGPAIASMGRQRSCCSRREHESWNGKRVWPPNKSTRRARGWRALRSLGEGLEDLRGSSPRNKVFPGHASGRFLFEPRACREDRQWFCPVSGTPATIRTIRRTASTSSSSAGAAALLNSG